MAAEPEQIDLLIRRIRACFHRLKAAGDALHDDLGITAAMRGVMETLAEGGPRTVPDIARDKGVSRQHIQVLADALARAGLAAFKDNPAHKRSSLVALTDTGRAAFEIMRDRERAVLADIAESLDPVAVDAAIAALETLNDTLKLLTEEGDDRDQP